MEDEENYYPEPTCMMCGKICKIYEIHEVDSQMWAWCSECEIDTFHKPINDKDEDN